MSAHITTLDDPTEAARGAAPARAGLRLVVVWHRDPTRIGAHAWVPWGGPGASVELSRQEPVWSDGRPLDDPHVSRSPLQLLATADGVECWPMRSGLRFDVAGASGREGHVITVEALARGVRIGLGRGALLHVRLGPPPSPVPDVGLVGASAEIEAVLAATAAAARSVGTVLVTGESGTGKELVARGLHALGPRAEGRFVAVNAAALSPALGADQLFGHVRGAFVGAERDAPGYFGEADGGTLFLDEIDACPPEVQAQLLRAIETGEIQPLGGPPRRVDLRIVSATSRDLSRAAADGTFRAPLYHRLAHATIRVPPLRERPGDVAVQVARFVREELARRGRGWPEGGETPWLGRAVVEALMDGRWPGNTRQLRATVARMVERDVDQPTCGLPDLSEPLPAPLPAAPPAPPPAPAAPSPAYSLHFQVSRDEEHVALTVRWGAQVFTPRSRAHAYTLLTLARARMADEAAGELPTEERGWIHRDELCRRLRLDPNLLLTHLFRARRQLADAGVPGADELVERRLDAGQLRIGTAAIEIVQA